MDVPSLERIIATGKLLTTKNPASLIELHEELSKNQPATSQIESREDELAEEVLRKSKEFSKKRPTKSYFHETTQKIDEMSSELQRLRERTEIDFIRQKRSIFGVTNDRQIEVRDSDLQELYVSDRCHSLALSFIEKAEQGSPLHRLSKTLKRISKDSQFIAYASTAGGVSLRKILGFIDIESESLEADYGIIFGYCILDANSDKIYQDWITKEDIKKYSSNKREVMPKEDTRVIHSLIRDMSNFTRLVGHFSSLFDIPFIRTRALMCGLEFPTYGVYVQTDTWRKLKNKYKLSRNSLQNACEKLLGASRKDKLSLSIKHACLRGEEWAIKDCKEHCEKDVLDTKDLYNAICGSVKSTKTSI